MTKYGHTIFVKREYISEEPNLKYKINGKWQNIMNFNNEKNPDEKKN